MNHQEIIKLIGKLEICALTKDNFETFVQNANGFFLPKGTKFQQYLSFGYNELSKNSYDWSKGKPEWEPSREFISTGVNTYRRGDVEQAVFDRIEPITFEDRRGIHVHFNPAVYSDIWSINPKRLPLKIAFSTEAFYVAEQEGNGTPEMPYEHLYVKL